VIVETLLPSPYRSGLRERGAQVEARSTRPVGTTSRWYRNGAFRGVVLRKVQEAEMED
jgi:hypothetical protein